MQAFKRVRGRRADVRRRDPAGSVPLRLRNQCALRDVSVEPWTTLLDALREVSASPERKRVAPRCMRCLHGAGRWSPGAFLPDTHARVRDREITTIEGLAGCDGRFIQCRAHSSKRRAPVRLLHAWPDRLRRRYAGPRSTGRCPSAATAPTAVLWSGPILDEREIRERMSGTVACAPIRHRCRHTPCRRLVQRRIEIEGASMQLSLH